MTIRNASSGTVGAIYIGVNSSGTPNSFTHFIQAEASTFGGAAVADAEASGGNALDITLPVAGAEAEVARWALDGPSQLKEGAGRYFRVIGRFAIVSAGGGIPLTSLVPFAVRLKIMSGTNVIWTGPRVIIRANYALRDFGVIPLPPASLPFTEAFTLSPLNLSLWGDSMSGSTKVVSLDALQFTPLDSYRTFEMAAEGLTNGRTLHDEPHRGYLFQYDSSDGNNRSNVFTASGTWIWLRPGQATRIIFLTSLTDGTASIGKILDLSISYRARRLTI
jgi:hypothetical protein